MTDKITAHTPNSITTPNNLRLFNTVFPTLGEEISKDILDLLSKNPEPDEMINHYIEKKRFDIAIDLTNEFFSKEESMQREKYYMHIFTGVATVLKQQITAITTDNKKYEEIYMWENMLNEIYDLGEWITNRETSSLNNLCKEILKMNTIFADKIVFSLRMHFGCEWGFSLRIPASLIKQKTYPTLFKHGGMRSKSWLSYDNARWENLEDTDQLSLSLDRKWYVRIDKKIWESK